MIKHREPFRSSDFSLVGNSLVFSQKPTMREIESLKFEMIFSERDL
jgi:hypothetical protein